MKQIIEEKDNGDVPEISTNRKRSKNEINY